jgi:pimeloyl-[acyl-carrier protein] methyl ester esterase
LNISWTRLPLPRLVRHEISAVQIESVGEGPDIVLIHGWAMHSGIFAPLTDLLAAHFRVHLVDLPGHGTGIGNDAACAPAECAAALAAELPRALWVGWSLGGIVALHAALAYSHKVNGIVLIAASPRFVLGPDWPHGVSKEIFQQFGAGLHRDYRRTIERFIALEAMGSDRTQMDLRELKARAFERGEPSLYALEQGLQTLDSTDLRARLPELTVPSLWIAGRRDRLVPAAAMRWAAANSPQGSYLEISSGHAPFIAHAAEISAVISSFAHASAP